MLLQIIFMKCWETEIGPDIETSQQWQCHCRSLSSFTQTKLFTPSCLGHYHQASRANSFWGVSYLRWLLILRQGQYHHGGVTGALHKLSFSWNVNGQTFVSVFARTTWRCIGSGRVATWRDSTTLCPREWGLSTSSPCSQPSHSQPGRQSRQVRRGNARKIDSGKYFFWSSSKRDWFIWNELRAREKCCREMLQVAKREEDNLPDN